MRRKALGKESMSIESLSAEKKKQAKQAEEILKKHKYLTKKQKQFCEHVINDYKQHAATQSLLDFKN